MTNTYLCNNPSVSMREMGTCYLELLNFSLLCIKPITIAIFILGKKLFGMNIPGFVNNLV